ncbi:FtsX-like permease family protein [Flavobacterium sp.]|uniref:ABC transporter permease n=1 Tax=Flavobacterium sp. TaxID=239 RepID=UPI00261C1FEF|nr:FtsX-like permease family protein [Flavobacterium sp.]
MNLEYFIAKRLISTKEYKSSISAPIIKIAVVAIAMGIIMMIISVATGIGLQQKIRQKVSAFNGHIIISSFTDNQSDVSTNPISLNQKFYPNFKNIEGIQHVQAVASKAGIIRTESAFEPILYKGVGKDYKWDNISEYLISGRIPNLNKELTNEILISEYLAKRLNIKLNDSFNTFFIKEGGNGLPKSRRFKIVGIYNSGFPEFDAAYIIGDIRHLQKINRWNSNQVGSFEIFVDDFDKIEEKGKEVYEEVPSTLNSQTIVEKFYYIFEWLKLFDFNILLVIGIMILVSIINMVVALLVLILEKTQMIGILKSIGANNVSIRKIFLYQASYLILKGLFYGNIIGLGLLLIQKYFKIVKLNPESYYVNTAPVDINLFFILVLNFIVIVMCLLVLIIPSYIISKISPSKTIRFD